MTSLFSDALAGLVNAVLDEPGLRPSTRLAEALERSEDALRGLKRLSDEEYTRRAFARHIGGEQ